MAANIQVDRRTRTLHLTITGDFTTDEIVTTIQQMKDAIPGETAYSVFSDHRGATMTETAEQIRMAAKLLGSPGSPFRGGRWAVVSASDATFGMMRILAVQTEDVPIEMEVFRDVESADSWLAREL